MTNPLVDSLPRSRECLDHPGLNVNDPQEASCEIGPVIRLSLALDKEEDILNESKGLLQNDRRGRRACLSAREKGVNSRSRSANSIIRD